MFFLQVILIDSVFRKDKMSNFSDGIEIYSDDSYNVDSDKECSHDSDDYDNEHFDGKMLVKKIKCMNLFSEKKKKIIF